MLTLPPIVIASEAKQSRVASSPAGLLRRYAPRNDGRENFIRSESPLRRTGVGEEAGDGLFERVGLLRQVARFALRAGSSPPQR
jgi:hypothetical protein